MMLVMIAVAMLAWGMVVDRAGRKLGTLLATLPFAVYFVVLWAAQLDGHLDSRETSDLSVSLLVGLLAFLSGPNIMNLVSRWRKRRRGTIDDE